MKTRLTEKFLNQKRIQNFATQLGLEIWTGLDSTTDEDDIDSLELNIAFNENTLKDTQTADDVIIYRIRAEGLFYSSNYQVDGVSDLPYWIESVDQLKEVLTYISNEGK